MTEVESTGQGSGGSYYGHHSSNGSYPTPSTTSVYTYPAHGHGQYIHATSASQVSQPQTQNQAGKQLTHHSPYLPVVSSPQPRGIY